MLGVLTAGLVPAVAHAQTAETESPSAVAGDAAVLAAEAFAASEVEPEPDGTVPLVVVTETDGGMQVEVVEVADEAEAAAVLAEQAQGGELVAAQIDEPVELLVDSVVDAYAQWPFNLGETSFPSAWTVSRGAGQVVAVVDTGVYRHHEDLADAVLAGAEFINGGGGSTGDGRVDLNGHGTHVAGIIAARAGNGVGIAGAAPEAKILPVRVLRPVYDDKGKITSGATGTASDVAKGIIWAADHGATVINLSLGASGDLPIVNAAIGYAIGKGIPVVAAAGNGGANTRSYPAAAPDGRSIAVAATDRDRQLAVYSSWWASPSYVDIAAPGSVVISTWSPEAVGANGTKYMGASGTSMATPHVAAAVALIRSARPDLDVDAVRAVLEGTAADIGTAGFDAQTGAGQVDPAAALGALTGNILSPGSGYRALPGARVIDTRSGAKIGAGQVVTVLVSAAGSGVPASAAAAALNVTAVEAEWQGFLTAWPAAGNSCIPALRPDTSTVNYVTGDVRATGAIVGLGGTGRICVYSSAPTHLLVDVVGYLAPELTERLTPVVPRRLIDTRHSGMLGPGSVLVPVPGAPAGTTAAAVNLTVTQAKGDGFMTVYPAGPGGTCSQPPATSNLNFRAGMTRANLAYATLGGAAMCVYSSVPAHVIVDLTAYIGTGGEAVFVARAPQRLVDTRHGTGMLQAASTTSVPVASGTVAAQLNVTATEPEGDGFLTVWPCRDARPDTSTVNYRLGETSPNGTTVSAAGGAVCYASNVPTHVIVDTTGAWVRP